MNFDVLNQTEQAFGEIRLLYAAFNINPSEGVDLLYDDPTIIQRQKDIQDTRDYVKLNPPTRPSAIIGFSLRRLPDERQPRSGQDLENWLYHNRLEPLLQSWSTLFKQELSVVDSNNRTIRLQEYKQLLDTLSKDITDFEGKTVDTFPKFVNDKTADWPNIFRILNDYLPVVERAIASYNDIIKNYLPVQGIAVENPKPANQPTGKQKTILVNPAPKGQTKLSLQQTMLLMHYLRKSGLVWEYIQDTTLAKCFSVLTGFSENTLRQSVGDKKPEETSSESDFRALIGQLQTMLAKLKTDADKLF